MNKLITVLIVFSSFVIYGQQPTLDWVKTMQGTGYEYGNSTLIDQSGNTYTTGLYRSTTDFDPGPGTLYLTPSGDQDVFLLKLDPNGNFIWCIGFGGGTPSSSFNDTGNDLALDSQGNIIVTGIYKGTCDFDPGAGTFSLTSNSGNADIFIAKYNPSGSFIWAKGIGGISIDIATSVDVDISDNIIVSGQFYGNTDFDPGAGTYFLASTLPYSNGSFSASSELFNLKLNSNGDFVWANKTGDYSSDLAFSAIDAQGNVFSTGKFAGTADFDPGTGTNNLSSPASYYAAFVRKLDANGNFVWAYGYSGSAFSTEGTSISIDQNGNVIVVGFFQGTVDFDQGAGSFNLTSSGGTDAFVLKLSNNGDFIWAKQIGVSVTNESFQSVTVDSQNNVYLIGNGGSTSTINTIDMNPNAGSYLLSSSYGSYLISLKSNGDFNWAISPESSITSNFVTLCETTTSVVSGGFCMDVSDNAIYITGAFDQTVDFDPSSGTFNITATNNNNSKDIFVHKLLLCQNTTSSLTTTSCGNYSAPSGSIHTTSEIFNDTIPNAGGCDSIITINLTINQNTLSLITVSECGSYTAPDSQIYSVSGNYIATIPNSQGCDSIITINLTINQNTSSSISPSACGSYTAPDGQIYTIGGNYSAIIPNAAGCDSTISINLTINPLPIISAGLDQTVCDGISVTLTGSGGAVYTWDNSIVNGVSFIPPVGINEYVVSGMSVNGCFKTDTVIVTVNPLPNVSFTIDETTGCAPLVFNLTNTTLNSLNCNWDISNGDDLIGCGTVTGLLNQVGCHDITLTTTDNNGCLNSFTAMNIICVEALPNASFSATPNSFSQPGEQISFTNNSTGASSYSWNFGDSSPTSNLVDPTHVFEVGVQDSFIVELIAFSLFGCSDTFYLTIYSTPINDSVDTDIFIPTGFSPNNDNENDTWMVTGLEKYPNTIINVFNRWGQLLFEGGLDNSTWSGIYQGEILPTADYYYIIDLGNGTKFNGVVTLKQ